MHPHLLFPFLPGKYFVKKFEKNRDREGKREREREKEREREREGKREKKGFAFRTHCYIAHLDQDIFLNQESITCKSKIAARKRMNQNLFPKSK